MAVYNVAGEKVRTQQQDGAIGTNTMVWAGDNNAGERCASGYYIVRMSADAKQGDLHGTAWLRMVITR